MYNNYIFIVLLISASLQNYTANVTYGQKKLIYKGAKAEPSDAPYHALLFLYRSSQSAICGGSLISSKFVLTAASCLFKTVKADVSFAAKSLEDNGPNVLKMSSNQFIIHENYSNIGHVESYNNIGLVKLPKEVAVTENVQTVPLPPKSDKYKFYFAQAAIVTGFGSSLQRSNTTTFKQVEIVIYSFQGDRAGAKGNFGGSPCRGDMGSPMVIKNPDKTFRQIGVVAYSAEYGCDLGFPIQITMVGLFLDWIENNAVGIKINR